MAVSVTANLTTVAQGESTDAGTWSGNSGGYDTEVFYQNTASYTWQASKNARTNCTYTPTTNIDMSGTDNHLYWWAQNAVASFMENKTTGTVNTSGYMIRLTDGTGNYKEWHIAGKDTWGGEWKCFVLDVSSSTDVYTSSGALDLSDIDVITWYVDISNSGNIRIIDNQWNDVVRFGTGLTATGTDFNIEDIWTDDYLLANKYGILERVGNTFFSKGKIIIGDGATTTVLDSEDEKLEFLAREATGEGQVSDTLYEFKTTGSGCIAVINNLIISGGSINSAGRFYLDLSDINADTTFDGCIVTLAGLTEGCSATDSDGCVFNNCLQISPKTGIFTNHTIKNYVGTDGAILFPTDDTNISNLTFINCDNGVEYDATSDSTTPTFYNFTFDDEAGNYDVNNTSGAVETITISGGGNANSYNPAGDIITFSNPKSFKFTVSPSIIDYEWRIYSVTALGSLDGSVELDGEENATADNQTYNYTYSSDIPIAVQIISQPDHDYEEEIQYFTLVSTNQDVGIVLTPDNNN
ncbi:MAG: hypothetical protein ACTSQF_00155 [Candidatus Heimdallarchaeaceae archaeon]